MLFRYMIGDVVAGGCVVAASWKEAEAKVRAYYCEFVAYGDSYLTLKDEEITVWGDGEGFIEECPDVVEVYP